MSDARCRTPWALLGHVRVAFQTGGQEEGQGRHHLHASGEARASELDDVQAGAGLVVEERGEVSMEAEQ